jgi:ankyrin repeat protein
MKKFVTFLFVFMPLLTLAQNSACDSLVNLIILDKTDRAKKIISQPDFDVNCLSSFLSCPLGIACSRGNLDLVKYLLRNGASPNLIQKRGETPLFDAVYIYPQALEPNKYPASAGKKYDYKIKDTIVDLLIINGADIYHADSTQTNLLMRACMFDRYYVVEKLLKKGFNINEQNSYGSTSLMFAVWRANYKIVELLLKYGADIHCMDNEGRTALDIAKENENIEIMSLILEYKR